MFLDIVKSVAILGVLIPLSLMACKDSQFKATGGSGTQVPPNDANQNPTNPYANNRAEENLPNLGQGAGNSADTTNGSAGCIKNENSRYNIIFVFDQSGSQNSSDPQRIRGSAAAAFVQRLTDPSKIKGEVYVNMMGFNSSAMPGPGGWTKLDPSSITIVQNNIIQTTPAPPAFSGTKFAPALQLAQQMLSQLPNQNPNQRNFVVFLTDGKPSDDEAYPSILQQLVTGSRATIIAVAAGSGVKGDGEAVVQAMALPQVASNNQMAGLYQRARSPSDLAGVYDQIFQAITNCN